MARRQAAGALILFYGLVYGTAGLVPYAPRGVAASMLSILLLGALMLLGVAVCIRRGWAPVHGQLLKKVQIQGAARSDGYPPQVGAGVLSTYVAAPRECGNAIDGPFSAAC